MSDREKIQHTAHELMECHVEALFTFDQSLRLHRINEPWPGAAPAPRFFLGRTLEGTAVCRFRHDVPDTLAMQLEALSADEPVISGFHTKPRFFDSYMELLQGQKFTSGPCYLIPAATAPPVHAIQVTRENVAELSKGGFEWLVPEIDYVQPCIAIVHEGLAVSVCRSVRVTSRAHEAGLETLEPFRGRGYASVAVAGWAAAVRNTGRLPLYSTSNDNFSSQSVARKAGLVFYGVNFTIT